MKRCFLFLGCMISLNVFPQMGNTNETPGTTTITPGGGVINTTGIDKTAVETPTTVITKFNKAYPGVRPHWKMEGQNFHATYTDPKTRLQNIVVYDKAGNVIRRENELDPLNYPPGIVSHYKKDNSAEKYSVWQTEDASGKKGYYGSRKNKIQWFDENGEIVIRRKKPVPQMKAEPQLKQANPGNK